MKAQAYQNHQPTNTNPNTQIQNGFRPELHEVNRMSLRFGDAVAWLTLEQTASRARAACVLPISRPNATTPRTAAPKRANVAPSKRINGHGGSETKPTGILKHEALPGPTPAAATAATPG